MAHRIRTAGSIRVKSLACAAKTLAAALLAGFCICLPTAGHAQSNTVGSADTDTEAGEKALAAATEPGDTLAEAVAKAIKANPALAGEIVEAAIDLNTPRSMAEAIVNAAYGALRGLVPGGSLQGVRAQLQAIANAELANRGSSPERTGGLNGEEGEDGETGDGFSATNAANLAGSFPGGVSGGGSGGSGGGGGTGGQELPSQSAR